MKRDDAINLVKQGFEQLEHALEAGRSDDLIRYMATMSRFHNYSFRNTLLIWLQNPDATQVAGFQAWKKLGRIVKKGEKGIAIFAPMPFRKNGKTNVDGAKRSDSDSEETLMMGFKVVHVFDLSQTEGEPLPGIAQIKGSVGMNLARIKRVVTQSDIELVIESIDGSANGYSAGGKIVIEESLSDVESFAVIAHEIAHERLHHGGRRGKTTKTIRETEAEAVAFIVSNAFGIDSATHSSDYIQLYSGDSDTLRESLSHIQSTAEWIIEAIHGSELPCDHSMSLHDDNGRVIGTWKLDETTVPSRYVCGVCQKFYGYVGSKSSATSKVV